MEENLERLSCYDCGAPFDPERGVFSCVPESGPGITIISEEQMAAGEQVALTRRVYLDEARSQAIPAPAEGEGTPEGAAWLLGPVGAVLPKDRAEALGLKEGADFGAVPDLRVVLAEQERANRSTMRRSDATVIVPGPIQTESTPERAEFHRETGGDLSEAETEQPAPPAARTSTSATPQPSGGAARASRA